ncbi:hypothetical protein [Caldimonas tepidiphila]|uniref:hypothetical protein n=1 Tax=Caldimonas tepidiphila TaxID=2315841 RepID=UPI001300385B|nr:hypothetical protein [Caldimonas tepidiphila]
MTAEDLTGAIGKHRRELVLRPASVLLALGLLAYCPPPHAAPRHVMQARSGFYDLLNAALARGLTFAKAADLIDSLSAAGSTPHARRVCEEIVDKAGPEAVHCALAQLRKLESR